LEEQIMVRYSTARWTSLGAVAALLLALVVLGQGQAQPPGEGELKTVRGKVERFTTAPKGEVDGAVLSGGTVIHWPPHLEGRFKGILTKGDRVEAAGRMETGPEGDTKLEVRRVTNLRTEESRTNDDVPPPKGPKGPKGKKGPKGLAFGAFKTVKGTVERFTMAPKGEVDGAVLSGGTVIHWPPHLEGRFKGILAKGDRVEAIGRMETGPEGDAKLEVQRVTNLRTGAARVNEDLPAPPPPDLRSADDRPRDTEARLRALEDKVDRLIDEIRRSRREK